MKRTSSQLKQLARESLAHRFSLPVMAYVITFGIDVYKRQGLCDIHFSVLELCSVKNRAYVLIKQEGDHTNDQSF